MGVFRQIRLVLWKNFTIRRRRWVNTVIDMFKVKFYFCLSENVASCNLRIDLAAFSLPYSHVGTNTELSFLL